MSEFVPGPLVAIPPCVFCGRVVLAGWCCNEARSESVANYVAKLTADLEALRIERDELRSRWETADDQRGKWLSESFAWHSIAKELARVFDFDEESAGVRVAHTDPPCDGCRIYNLERDKYFRMKDAARARFREMESKG